MTPFKNRIVVKFVKISKKNESNICQQFLAKKNASQMLSIKLSAQNMWHHYLNFNGGGEVQEKFILKADNNLLRLIPYYPWDLTK